MSDESLQTCVKITIQDKALFTDAEFDAKMEKVSLSTYVVSSIRFCNICRESNGLDTDRGLYSVLMTIVRMIRKEADERICIGSVMERALEFE
jgi:hypothetical protein